MGNGRMHELSGLPTEPLPALGVLLHVLSNTVTVEEDNGFRSWAWVPFGDGPNQWIMMWAKEAKVEGKIIEKLGFNQRPTNLWSAHQCKINPTGVSAVLECRLKSVTAVECHKVELLEQVRQCQFILLCSLGILRICCMYFIGYMMEGSIKITTNHYLMSLKQAFKTILQESLNVLPFRKDLTCAVLQRPGLLINDYKILWSWEVQAYLQQAATGMICNRNLILSNKC